MALVTITNKLTDPGGNPLPGIPVVITIVTAAGGRRPGITATSSITQPEQVVTAADGTWTAQLTPNSDIVQPGGSYYTVNEGGYTSAIIVPASGGPYELAQVLTGATNAPQPTYVLAPATITVDDNGAPVATRPAINLIPGTGMVIGAVDNPSAQRVDVTLTSTGGVTLANTVADATTYGQSPTAGADTDVSRGDHTHGTPALGTTSSTAAAGNDARITGAAQKAANLSDLANAATARTNLGLGTAATQDSSAFDAAGAAAAAQAASLQKSADLADLTSASTARSNLGLGTAATQPTGAFDAAGAAAAVQAASLQKASNLADLNNASTARTNLGLGGAATANVGTTAGTVAAGDDSRFTVAPGYYPLSGYGFCSIAAAPEGFIQSSNFDSGTFFVVRMWVPAGQPITSAWVNIRSIGTFTDPLAPFNGAVVYEDNGTQAGISADTPTLWSATGWRSVALTSTIAAQTVGRFVRVGFLARGWSTMTFYYAFPNDTALLNGGAAANRRNILATGVTSPPASIDPTTYGTDSSFLPVYALAPA